MADLLVFIEGRFAGEITAGAGNTAELRYDGSYLRKPRNTPLSLSAPLGHGHHEVGRWLDGLLPDSTTVRRRWAGKHRAATAMPVDLLSTPIGLDCAGAVQFCPPGDEDSLGVRSSGLEPQSEHEIAEWIRLARKDWSAWEGLGSRGQFSLAGAQAKCAAHWDGAQWHVPYGDIPTTHILKPGAENYTDAEVVEHVCLTAARHLGIEAASTELAWFESERVVVVTRFDRSWGGGTLQRRHHEDICQAMRLDPEQKYQAYGGSTPEEIAALMWQESTDAHDDLSRFFDALVYNWAIAAPDAHAKNYSLVLDGTDVHLTPLYDVISLLPYAQSDLLQLRTAMSFSDDFALRAMGHPSAWEDAGRALGIDPDWAGDRAVEVLRRTPSAISDVIDGLTPEDRRSRTLLPLSLAAKSLSDQLLTECASGRSSWDPVRGHRQRTQAAARKAVVCGAELPAGGACARRLLSKPCPLHPTSTGSRNVRGG